MASEGRGSGSRRGGDGQGRSGRSGGPSGSAPRGGDGRSSGGRSGGRSGGGKQASGGRRSAGKDPRASWPGEDAGRGRRDDRRARNSEDRPRTTDQATYDGPPIDEAITGQELDRSVAQQLRGLPEKLAARVARHLVAAGQLMDSDPATAYKHALAARARAARIAVVREACGEAAYAAGEYSD